MKTNYTSRAIKYLQDLGYTTGVVERWLPGINVRKDLFGFIDLIAIKDGEILGVQSTSYPQRKNHLDKIKTYCMTDYNKWIGAGGKFMMITWKKEKKIRGGIAFRYIPFIDTEII